MFIKLYQLLTSSERTAGIFLFNCMLIGMALETLGISLIIPVMTMMMQNDLAVQSSVFSSLLNLFNFETKTELVAVVMLLLMMAYLSKNLFLAFLIWQQKKYTFNVRINIAERLFKRYLKQTYTFHISRNSSELIRNATTEVDHFAMLLNNLLIFLSEFLVVCGITLLLLFIEPYGTLIIAGLFSIFAYIYYLLTAKRISRWGKERQEHNGLRLKHLMQGLSSIKDVKLLGRESDFINQFQVSNTRTFTVMKYQAVIAELPRLLFEFLAVSALALLVVVMLHQNNEVDTIIPTLGLFAAAAFRLMPSVNRLFIAAQQFRYTMPVVNTLHEELCVNANLEDKRINLPINFSHELLLKDITYFYEGSITPVLDNISLTIRKGESTGIIGPSGSGKSTLVDLIVGLITPKLGSFKVDGKFAVLSNRGWKDKIGYVSQSIYLTDGPLKKNIAFGLPGKEINEAAVWRAIRASQLDTFVKSLPDGIETIVGENGIKLSGGQRQRIGIARALYHDPEILVLDEATSALDQETEAEVMRAVNKLHGKKTILIVAHRLTTVSQCDRLYRIDQGKTIETGTPEEILNNSSI